MQSQDWIRLASALLREVKRSFSESDSKPYSYVAGADWQCLSKAVKEEKL